MNKVQVTLEYEDEGNCRTYYRTLPNRQLICLQDEGHAGRMWYTCCDDDCWNEPESPIDTDINYIEIIKQGER